MVTELGYDLMRSKVGGLLFQGVDGKLHPAQSLLFA